MSETGPPETRWDAESQDALIGEFLVIAAAVSKLWSVAVFGACLAVMMFAVWPPVKTITNLLFRIDPAIPLATFGFFIGAFMVSFVYIATKQIADGLVNFAHGKGIFYPPKFPDRIIQSTAIDRIIIAGMLNEAMQRHRIKQITAVKFTENGFYRFEFSGKRAARWMVAAIMLGVWLGILERQGGV